MQFITWSLFFQINKKLKVTRTVSEKLSKIMKQIRWFYLNLFKDI